MTIMPTALDEFRSIILFDRKNNTYKLALIMSLVELAREHQDTDVGRGGVAIPLRLLAEHWLTLYQPFCQSNSPILVGRSGRKANGVHTADVSFRTDLETYNQSPSPESRQRAIKSLCRTMEMPIQYAGGGQWKVFAVPQRYSKMPMKMLGLAGTRDDDRCLQLSGPQWIALVQHEDLYNLCVQAWCSLVTSIPQAEGKSMSEKEILKRLKRTA